MKQLNFLIMTWQNGENYNGMKVIKPSELINFDCKVVIASEYYDEIAVQLTNMNRNNYEKFMSSIEFVFQRLELKGIELEIVDALQMFVGSGCGMERFYEKKLEVQMFGKLKKLLKKNQRKTYQMQI